MRHIVRVACLGAAFAIAAAPIALAQKGEGGAAAGSLNEQLAALAEPWLAEENPDGSPEEIAATADCVVAALDKLPDEVKMTMLAADDFEDALDVAVSFDQALEQPLEACF